MKSEEQRDYEELHGQPDDINDDEYFERDKDPGPLAEEDESPQ
jgi:hypothetical protein